MIANAKKGANPFHILSKIAQIMGIAGWSAILPVLKRLLPLPRLVALLNSPPHRTDRNTAQEDQAMERTRRIYRLTGRLEGSDCLERSLIMYRILCRLNADPILVVGLSKADDKALGHVWVLRDGEPIAESPEALARFTPVVQFGPRGEVLKAQSSNWG